MEHLVMVISRKSGGEVEMWRGPRSDCEDDFTLTLIGLRTMGRTPRKSQARLINSDAPTRPLPPSPVVRIGSENAVECHCISMLITPGMGIVESHLFSL